MSSPEQAPHRPHDPQVHAHAHAHAHEEDAGLADILDLDADVLGGYIVEAADWTAALADGTPRLVVDIGAGTGAGTAVLARCFPDAAVVAVDRSRAMLDRVEAAARADGTAGRVTVVQADLDDGWPAIHQADVGWASSSLHELADPGRLMRDVRDALVPGGLFVVVEMDTLPRLLPDDEGDGVEARLHDVLDRSGWNHHSDWGPHLERAGFTIAGRRTLVSEAASTPTARRYAETYLRRMRAAVDGGLDAPDLAALDELLEPNSPRSLSHRDDLVVRGSRTAWVARRP